MITAKLLRLLEKGFYCYDPTTGEDVWVVAAICKVNHMNLNLAKGAATGDSPFASKNAGRKESASANRPCRSCPIGAEHLNEFHLDKIPLHR
jgi:hypothetical protein